MILCSHKRRLVWVLAVLPLMAQTVQAADAGAARDRALRHVATFPAHTLSGPDHAFSVRDVVTDTDGSEHVRLDRFYRGLPVIGGDLVVHSDRNGGFRGASLTVRRTVALPTRPVVNASGAVRAALAVQAGNALAMPQLVVHARTEPAVLAWDVRVSREEADGTPADLHVIVDARTGVVIDTWDDVHTGAANGTGAGFHVGSVPLVTDQTATTTFYLRDPGRGNLYTIDLKDRTAGSGSYFTDADNAWGNGLLSDRATVGVDAQFGSAVTWDYYLSVHGRNGIDNQGRGGYNRVHYGKRYVNAFWTDSCFCMTYGDGDGSGWLPFTSLDVAGHEMTHGVTSRTANLTYSGESGGLNEATSDIFGTLVEFHAGSAVDPGDYTIGEKLRPSGTPLRYMHKPSLDGSSADCWYSGVGSLNVHYSSGPANHFFYLLAEGTAPAGLPASPTCAAGNTRTATGTGSLSGIGRTKAGAIWYRALTVYMTSSTSYAGARTATLKAADDLYGAGSAESAAVASAWSAILVN